MKLLAAILALLVSTVPPLAQTPGPIVAVGGGGTRQTIVARTLALAGGRDAVVVVLPQSSELRDAGDSSVTMWREARAKSARKVDFKDPGAKQRCQG